ncbi:hypothetical protein HanXRQr2_Chr17g0790331 [Helianthus annuus]|uniref:Uncharacterized protein n=1 Tax=Helianthus annuus TaxID=4232 RepID=A0A251RMA2_HELAN|nr:hypothetical protein HanXRQr2_Chr17g0790331 [Helianthus annuus]
MYMFVVGIEEIVNTSCSEVLSPRAPCTSFRTTIRKKVKKPETESLLATASRGVRRELIGEANEFLKTPAVSGVRKKGTATLTSGKKDATVQRVYNTRRSARLTEKKCTEAGVTERDISRPVKIASFSEQVSVASEKSAGSGSSSVETFLESYISSENTEDSDREGSGENCDEGISKAKVEDICIKFDKLDVVIEDGSDQSKVIEKVNCCSENLDVDEEQKVKEMVISNERQGSEEKSDQVENINPDSKNVSNSCDDGALGEKVMVGDEKIDFLEALNVSVEEHSDSLLSDEVLLGENSERVDCCDENVDLEETEKVEDKFVLNEPEAFEEKSDQVDDIKPDSKSISNSCDNGDSEGNVMAGDEKIDSHETLNVSVEEHLAPEEHSDRSLLRDEVVSGENSERVDFCGENAVLEEIQKVDDRFILNEPEVFEVKKNQVDNIKLDSEGITNPCENVDSEENLLMVDEKIEPHEALKVSAKFLTEADGSNTDSISCITENPSDPVASASETKDGIDFHEVLNVSIDEYLEHSDSLLCDKVLSEATDADSISCDTENISDPLVSVLETKNEVVECHGFTNNNESSSELSKLDNRNDHNVAMEMTAESKGTEENMKIVTNQGDEALVNPNEQERSKEYETSEESQNFLIKEPAVDQENETVTLSDDVIDHSTHLTPIKNETSNNNNNNPTVTRETSQVSDDNENIVISVQEVIVEGDNKIAEDEKPPTSLNDTSMRQLKKQLKALSIKSNLNANKDDQVAEARSVLQAMRDNHLATKEAS